MGLIEATVWTTVCTVGLCAAGSAVTVYAPMGVEPAVLGPESRLILDAVVAMLISSLLAIEIMTRLMPCRLLCGTIEASEHALRLWLAARVKQQPKFHKTMQTVPANVYYQQHMSYQHQQQQQLPPPPPSLMQSVLATMQLPTDAEHVSNLSFHWIEAMTQLEKLGTSIRSVDVYNWVMVLVVVVAHLFEGAREDFVEEEDVEAAVSNGGGGKKHIRFWGLFVSRVVIVFVHVAFMVLARMATLDARALAAEHAIPMLDELRASTTTTTTTSNGETDP